MDAISFVLGVPSSQLRSTNLADLIYRSGAGEGADSSKGRAARSKQQSNPKKACVSAYYRKDGADAETVFSRR